ncbi:MAG: sulfate ABC transporter permease subunit CysT [Planctomycetes bacterium]|nr:sulfate ABC transporter permease subunit CysT [Planctomycetota bacterium]
MLPGFAPTMALTGFAVGVVVVLPLAGLVLQTLSLDGPAFWNAATSPRALASYRLTFGASLVAAALNVALGLLVAWVLARYRFPGRALMDALVDLPFALPTAVAGLTLTALYSGDGWVGRFIEPLGLPVAFTRAGVTLALTFVGFPFVVRAVQPVIEDLDPRMEEAAAVLGASPGQTFARVVFPAILPALVTGFTLAFARAVGEYGSVVFISGNMPGKTEITPFLIVTRLEEYDTAGAAALGTVMLGVSFALLLGINMLQRWGDRRGAGRR